MAYKILMQLIPGNDSIWVEKLIPEDSSYIFETESEAENKIIELEINEPTRKCKIINL